MLVRSVISLIIYPIPSDLGSQDESSQASSTVGDHVRSPGTERFCIVWYDYNLSNVFLKTIYGMDSLNE